ncbi:MAG: hypothetical protein KJP16_06535 [Gammaproteobacteria bacterium]|nr:hypothetical protein [Gammaproteobacteria bacterium]NNL50461.1 hypothetical protein [Woeseiaceae bacterium]
MFGEQPQTLIVLVAGAFVVGWLLSYVSTRLTARLRAKKRDARDDRIRSLEAELRIAKTEHERAEEAYQRLEAMHREANIGIERRDNVISEQQAKLEAAAQDLKESVIKTRELRTELTDRVAESVHAEIKIREVETELSVAQASQEMLATGVLDYDSVQLEEDPVRAAAKEKS